MTMVIHKCAKTHLDLCNWSVFRKFMLYLLMSLQFWSYCSVSPSCRDGQRLLKWDWLPCCWSFTSIFSQWSPMGWAAVCWCGGSLLYSPQHAVVHQDTRWDQPLRIFSWGCVTIMELVMKKLYCSWSICMYTDINSFFAACNDYALQFELSFHSIILSFVPKLMFIMQH